VKSVAVALLFTGAILLFTKRFTQAKRDSLGIKDALILGFTQAIAIIPGISRSGITISTLLFRGIDREMSFKFSFLVSIPIILGATLLEVKNIGFALNGNFNGFLVGFIFSLSSGMVSLWLLRQILRKAKFYFFGYYCIIIGIITLLFI
jgi:undecaprenyl-diphosphatase